MLAAIMVGCFAGENLYSADNTYAITPGQIVAVSKENIGQAQPAQPISEPANDTDVNF